MTFNSISSLTSQGELATLGMFACSLTAFPVARLPSDSLLPIVIENQSDREFPQPKPHDALSRDAAKTGGFRESAVITVRSRIRGQISAFCV